MTPPDPEDPTREIESLLAARQRFARLYFSVLPGLIAAALLMFAITAERGNGAAWVLAGTIGAWSLGTAAGWIPAPPPPRGWWGGERRLDDLLARRDGADAD